MGNRRKPRNLKRENIVNIPVDEKVLLKIVPAKDNGEIIGDAYLYDDGSVDIVYTNKDVELATRQKIEAMLRGRSPSEFGLEL